MTTNLHDSFNWNSWWKKKLRDYRQTYHHCCLCGPIFFHQMVILEGLIFRSPYFPADLLPPCGNNIFRIKTEFQLIPQEEFWWNIKFKNVGTLHKSNDISTSQKQLFCFLFFDLKVMRKKNPKPILVCLMINQKLGEKHYWCKKLNSLNQLNQGYILATWCWCTSQVDKVLLYVQQYLINSCLLYKKFCKKQVKLILQIHHKWGNTEEK